MIPLRAVAFVMAGGEGKRLRPLTEHCPKPALPIAGKLKIVDFVLSNLYNSGIRAIYVLVQYRPEPLLMHIARAWTPPRGRATAFIRPLRPAAQARCTYTGTADSVRQNLHLLDRMKPDVVAVFAADHIYRMDVRQMIASHRERRADATIAAVPVPIERACRFGIISADAQGRVQEFAEKPRTAASIPGSPDYAYGSMGNYLFQPDVLRRALLEGAERGEHDFGHHVLPRLIATHRVYAYDFRANDVPGLRPHEERGYWRDVGTVEAYAAARQDLAGPRPRFALDNPAWPVRPLDHAHFTLIAGSGAAKAPTSGTATARMAGEALAH